MTILIKGGHVINPATQMDEVADVLIKDQKIKKIGKELPEKEAERVINADGCYVMPGFIDMHVHFRDPGFEQKEDIYTGMQAAAHGGYTTVLTMPNTKPVADNPDIVNYVHNKAKSGSCIHVLQVGAVTKGQQGKELADIEGMVKAGSPAISEDGKSVMDAALYRDGMLEAARLGIPVLAHCEDIHMVRGGVMNADAKAKELGLPGITNSVEDVIVARDIILAKDTGAQLHLCHCSTKDSVLMVKVAKEEGVRVSAEVCPHHFTLSTDDMKEADILKLQKKLNQEPFVKQSEYISKKQALKEQTEAMGTDPEEFLGYNPFTASIEIKLHSDYANSDSIAKIEKMVKRNSNIQDVLYRKELIDAVNDNIRNISLVLLALAVVLTFISFALINNTIRLAIYSKRFLIHTMKLVGASWSFIRRPFLRRNVWSGVLAAVVADAILMGTAYWAVTYEQELLQVITPEVMLIVCASVLVFGIVITWLCAYFSMNKYLRMKANSLYYI